MEAKWKLPGIVLGVGVLAACVTDSSVTDTMEPTVEPEEPERINIYPHASPVEAFRERMATYRQRMDERIEAGETLPSDVLARWGKMVEMEARLSRKEAEGYREKVTGPGQSILVIPDPGLASSVSASVQCGLRGQPLLMDTNTSFVADSDAPGTGWWTASSDQDVTRGNTAWHDHSAQLSFDFRSGTTWLDDPPNYCKSSSNLYDGADFDMSEGGRACGSTRSYFSASNFWATYNGPDTGRDADCVNVEPPGGGGGGGGNEMPCDTNQWAPTGDCCDVFYRWRGREVCIVYP